MKSSEAGEASQTPLREHIASAATEAWRLSYSHHSPAGCIRDSIRYLPVQVHLERLEPASYVRRVTVLLLSSLLIECHCTLLSSHISHSQLPSYQAVEDRGQTVLRLIRTCQQSLPDISYSSVTDIPELISPN